MRKTKNLEHTEAKQKIFTNVRMKKNVTNISPNFNWRKEIKKNFFYFST